MYMDGCISYIISIAIKYAPSNISQITTSSKTKTPISDSMSDTLVYSAWSKDIDPLFASDKTMLYPTPTDIYSDRRMSDSTTSESNSPATEPDLSALDPVRKPSLPGLDQLLEPVDPSSLFGRRPSMISDLSLSNRRSASSTTTTSHALSSYSFPAIGLDNLGGGHGGAPSTSPNNGLSGGGGGATTPATSNSPYSVPPTDSPQFSTIPWNNDIQQQHSHHHHQHSQHSQHNQHNSHHHPHLHQPSSSPSQTAHHGSASASPPLNHSPKRRRSPAMTPPSPHHQQQLTPTGATPPATSPISHSLSSQQSQSDSSQPVRRPRGKLPKHTTDLLKEWLHAHSDHPYPSEDEKRDLCNRTKLSMSQVSNWMINARRRILAPATKPQSASSVTSDPYRSLPRQIGSMYPSHVYAPPHTVPGILRRPPPSQDTHTLRLYDPPYYPDSASAAPRYQAQSHPIYPQDRRLSYPNSAPPPYPDFQSSYSQFNSPRDLAPRYFTSHTDSL